MNLIQEIDKELKQNIDEKYKKTEARLFIEKRLSYGVRTPIVRNIAKKYWNKVYSHDKNVILRLCEELLLYGLHEHRVIAFQWAYNLRKKYTKKDFFIFESWLKNYVKDWSGCDDLSCGSLGELLTQYEALLPKVYKWTESKNKWLRRASAVSLIYPIRKKKYLSHILKTADKLLIDKEDLVQKGYGWMLKEASNNYQKEIFDYVMKNRDKMPRTSLRYAIEKLPKEMKNKIMKK